MRERSDLALKVLCGLALAFALWRLGLAITHINPLYHAQIPALPVLASDEPQQGSTAPTNSPLTTALKLTNISSSGSSKSTNLTAHASNSIPRSTELASGAPVKIGTNVPVGGTNPFSPPTIVNTRATNTVQATNSDMALQKPATNNPAPGILARGNMPGRPPGMFAGMPPGNMPGMPKPGPALPTDIQARIDRVIDSEILAPVMRPMPMALLGIAGQDAFFRAPNGQTGLLKEGEELGGVKLIRIGVNRVLVEEKGERKELMIFAGLGSESLLSTQKDSPK